jgi:hypothetical protein
LHSIVINAHKGNADYKEAVIFKARDLGMSNKLIKELAYIPIATSESTVSEIIKFKQEGLSSNKKIEPEK